MTRFEAKGFGPQRCKDFTQLSGVRSGHLRFRDSRSWGSEAAKICGSRAREFPGLGIDKLVSWGPVIQCFGVPCAMRQELGLSSLLVYLSLARSLELEA